MLKLLENSYSNRGRLGPRAGRSYGVNRRSGDLKTIAASPDKGERVASWVLAIDQGTTSTQAVLFRADTSIASFARREFQQHFAAEERELTGWAFAVRRLPA
jgi:hypothetical protein